MCGILGYTGKQVKLINLVNKLKQLEYRGYDSWGYATNKECNKYIGEVDISKVDKEIKVPIFIAHSRWATHGKVNIINTHPHTNKNGNIKIVHNGIIENYLKLKKSLIKLGYEFTSETDSEVIAHLFNYIYYDKNKSQISIEKAVNILIKEIKGSFSIIIMIENKLIGLKKGDLSLLFGTSRNNYILTSDIIGFNDIDEYFELKDNEFIIVEKNKYTLYENGIEEVFNLGRNKKLDKNIIINKQNYEHYMLKEIYEQSNIIKKFIDIITSEHINNIIKLTTDIDKIYITGCGSAYHSGLVGKYLIEMNTELDVEVDVASEFRYREFTVKKNSLVIAISQSGETADTIASIKKFKEKGIKVISICNTKNSTIHRLSDYFIYTNCGKEIAVAATKSYISQILQLYMISKIITNKDDNIDRKSINILSKLLQNKEYIESIKNIAKELYKSELFFFLGRGINYPTVLEGALKLKEIAYIHSEACSAGEIKHGTIALVDNKTSSVCILIKDDLYDKMWSNIQEIKARGTNIILISDDNIKNVEKLTNYHIKIPQVSKELSPIATTITLQLLAYYIAKEKGCPIDKPRNLAKSVTVE